jgi:hypothetical protein
VYLPIHRWACYPGPEDARAIDLLVSSLIVIFYLSSQLQLSYTGYILGATLPSTALLLFCGDVLRALRKRMYDRIAAVVAPAAA